MRVWCVGVIHKRSEVAASYGGNSREGVGGSEQPQTRPAAGSDYCDRCGSLTTDPRIQNGEVICGVCAREERLKETDHTDCQCPRCGGTEDL